MATRGPMRTIAGLVLLAAAACQSPATLRELERVRSGHLDVRLLTDDEGLTTGRDTVTVEFRDAAGQLVDVGPVRASATMPMAGMPPMLAGVAVAPSDVPGRYVATTELTMAGEWRLSLDWNGPQGAGTAAFSPAVN